MRIARPPVGVVGEPYKPSDHLPSVWILPCILQETRMTAFEKLLFGRLLKRSHWIKDCGDDFPSRKQLGLDLGVSVSTVAKGLRRLQDLDLIVLEDSRLSDTAPVRFRFVP